VTTYLTQTTTSYKTHKFKDNSLIAYMNNGDKLARQIKDEGIRIRYGSLSKEKSDSVHELALWTDSEGKFYEGNYQ